MPLNWQSVFN
uniref:Uncharacterized protein n=1 Tax=Anguilla anguilla TaxID=7936 RepID=A0A0E9RRK3_ANGAN